MPEEVTNPPSTLNAETHDLTEVRVILAGLIKGLNAGPKSRARSLVVTKLEEASMWAVEAMARE